MTVLDEARERRLDAYRAVIAGNTKAVRCPRCGSFYNPESEDAGACPTCTAKLTKKAPTIHESYPHEAQAVLEAERKRMKKAGEEVD